MHSDSQEILQSRYCQKSRVFYQLYQRARVKCGEKSRYSEPTVVPNDSLKESNCNTYN